MKITIKDGFIILLLVLLTGLTVSNYLTGKKAYVQSELISAQSELITKQENYINQLKGSLKQQQDKLQQLLQNLNYVGAVKATTYYPVPEQTDDTPLITASGHKIDPGNASNHRWVAVSRDLHSRWGGPLSFGEKIYITGVGKYDGVYTVMDTMNRRWSNRVDILQSKGSPTFSVDNVNIFSLRDDHYTFVNNLY